METTSSKVSVTRAANSLVKTLNAQIDVARQARFQAEIASYVAYERCYSVASGTDARLYAENLAAEDADMRATDAWDRLLAYMGETYGDLYNTLNVAYYYPTQEHIEMARNGITVIAPTQFSAK